MRSAPSVTYPVVPARAARRILWIIWASGPCCACAYSYQFGSNWRTSLLWALVALSTLAVWGLVRQARSARQLAWDGAGWSLDGAQPLRTAQAAAALDFQSTLLLRLHAAGRPVQWLWLTRRAAPERWSALRRAVYSRAPSPEAALSAAATGSSPRRSRPLA